MGDIFTNTLNLDRQRIIFVGGKGGVGKTTCAAAIAHHFANQGEKILLISTDPAHSLGDVLEVKLSHHAIPVTEYLFALELDAEKVTERHFTHILETISLYAKPEMMAKLKKQLDLAKQAPGGQEAALLESICQHITTFQAQGYDRLIFDTAPSGHTLRLLVLPEMMSGWTEGLIAQQKKQRQLKAAAESFWNRKDDAEISPLSEKKQLPWQQALQKLEKRKTLFKEARDLLHNDNITAIILVMLAEKLPLFETERTLQSLADIHFHCTAVIINQIIDKSHCDNVFWTNRYHLQQQMINSINEHINTAKLWVPLKSQQILGSESLLHFFDDAY